MRLNWQQASSNYRLRQKKRRNNDILKTIREMVPDSLYSRDENGGRMGTGRLGPHLDLDEDKEKIKVKREMARMGLKSLL